MSKPSKTVPPGTPAEYMFETCEDFSCTCLTEGADLTVDDGKYQRPLWGTFHIPKLEFLKVTLCSNSTDTRKEE